MSDKLIKLLEEINTLPEFLNLTKLEVNSRGIFGNYPIHVVCTWQDKEAVKTLINNGANINSVGEKFETPIFRAVRTNNRDFLRFLIEIGANKYVKNNEGLSPIEVAVKGKYFESNAELKK